MSRYDKLKIKYQCKLIFELERWKAISFRKHKYNYFYCIFVCIIVQEKIGMFFTGMSLVS